MTGSQDASPRLRLMTFAPWTAAHSTPCATVTLDPDPLASRTRTARIVAPGAPPSPPAGLSLAATIPATWVPCPYASPVTGVLPLESTVKSGPAMTWPTRPECARSTPVSTTATVTPCPVYPEVFHAGTKSAPGAGPRPHC
jgi:hypothetical protein